MPRRGVSLVELIAAVTIVGIVVLLLMPAVLASRETASQIQCQNNLKQVALGMLNYNDQFEMFPAGYTMNLDSSGQPVSWGLAWSVQILPFVEQSTLAATISMATSMSAGEHLTSRLTWIRPFMCPSDISRTNQNVLEVKVTGHKTTIQTARSSYVGSFGTGDPLDFEKAAEGDGMFIRGRGVRLEEVLDGTSMTLLVGERTQEAGGASWAGILGERGPGLVLGSTWGDSGPNAKPARPSGYSSKHPEGAHFAFGDGSVRFIKDKVRPNIYGALATRRGGEVVPPDEDW